ncbi:MarR family winged helix-turn-helix transcriptional regulator [Rhodococcus sp. NPDC003382]|uniref:MarR family winged helix-turn-helix transcriptional regulator n=1 Tax=unclassified Rhodococcus (in: high G+C Gram-positive bacteria) TaxID=192944 RepID=UPI0018CE5C4C|nr:MULTISPECIES: MarR family transcriptional regulator [unclassified Rhodococcus (in: high G+C Gram-positive bacteria)]MBH0121282.1 MarR family transcriptional regulator [Rhodococcus sp. CX]MCK8671296.1 MarR family transcriptional regulator [Rhodococcus sp. HM1]
MTDPLGEAAPGVAAAALEQEVFALWRRGRSYMAASARAVDPKLDPVCYPLLVLLRDADAIAMSELIGALGIEKSTLTRRIDSAARLGLVERIPDPHDARARLVALTPEGRRRLEQQRAETFRRWRERLSAWDPDDVRQLATLMHRLGGILD